MSRTMMVPCEPVTPDPVTHDPARATSPLVGCAPAAEPLRRFAADPQTPFVLTLGGPGGCGKTTVLRAFAQVCAQVGIPVGGLEAVRKALEDPGHAVLLIDDAHQIDAPELELLCLLARTPGARLAVAYRPWPRRPVLAALLQVTPPVLLGHLDRTQIEDRSRTLLGVTPPPAVLEWLCTRSGGLPKLIDQMVLALRGTGAIDRPAPQVEAEIVEQLRGDLGSLDPQVLRLLLARALGGAADGAVLAQLLELEPAVVSDLIDAAQASGLVDGHGSLVPLARDALTSFASAVSVHPPAPPQSLAHRAQSAALAGKLDAALRLADQVIADPAAPDRALGIMVAAAVLAHRGLLARSAELYRWASTAQLGTSAPLAAVALLGTGELAESRRVLTDPVGTDRPPTLQAGAESLMAQGMHESVTGSPTAALSTLTRAAALLEPSGHSALLPDTPAALAGLVALHVGHFDVAESVLDRAVACRLGGPLAMTRHRLLQAWSAMLRGDHGRAHALLRGSSVDEGRLEPRDELLAAALQVGLARREGDLRALHEAWRRAREAIVRHPVDLLALLPLGELIVGAARLRDQAWVAPHLAEAHALLDRLGNPVLWATPLHWQGLHAAITGQQPQEAKRHAEALSAAAQHGPYPAMLATAARSWLQVMAGVIDAAAVESAARGLHTAGLAWEGSRLAGQAAIRNPNRKEVSALLALARGLHSTTASNASTANNPTAAGPSRAHSPTAAPLATLTEREREIATLLLESLTYKQIGERLFISAKTVEHHVARIRQRLGSDGRAELLAQLRRVLGY